MRVRDLFISRSLRLPSFLSLFLLKNQSIEMNPVTQPPGPYSGRSTLSFVVRVSVFTAGVVYGNMKLKYYRAKVRKYQKRLEAEAKAAAKAEAKAHH